VMIGIQSVLLDNACGCALYGIELGFDQF